MSSKKLIILLILSLFLFFLFMRYTLVSIQTESLKLDLKQFSSESKPVTEGINIINKDMKEFDYIKEINVLLIDNISKKAALWSKNGQYNVDYNQIPSNIVKSNTFFLEINNRKTMIINTDNILGDLEERILVNAYKYLKLDENQLNPSDIEYFPVFNEDLKIRYLRNSIIEAFAGSNDEQPDVTKVKYYLSEWNNYNEKNYNIVSQYDMYEGFQEYIKFKVAMKNHENLTLHDYVISKKNNYGFYNKEDEYKLIGLLTINYSYEKHIDINKLLETNGNIYNKLFFKIPLKSYENLVKYNDFEKKYDKYLNDIKQIAGDIKNLSSIQSYDYNQDKLISEKYDSTFKIAPHYYLYFHYKARLEDGSFIHKNVILAHVIPNKIQYKLDF